MTGQTFLTELTATLVPLLFAIATWTLLAAANWLRTKAKNEYVRGVIDRLTEAAETVVRETEQTVMADLKEASKDGVITEDEYKSIRDRAIQRTKDYLGKNGMRDLKTVFDEEHVEAIIRAKIEAQVHELNSKKDAAPPDSIRSSLSSSLA